MCVGGSKSGGVHVPAYAARALRACTFSVRLCLLVVCRGCSGMSTTRLKGKKEGMLKSWIHPSRQMVFVKLYISHKDTPPHTHIHI